METDLELAREILLQDQNKSLVLVKDGLVLGTGERGGVIDLLSLAEELGERARGTALADRVVGKAAAMIARSLGIASVYALLASELARETLTRGGIPLEYEQLVPTILNRKGDGPCPMEKLVTPMEDPDESVEALRLFISAPKPVTVSDRS